jgi:3-oxoacyl-[acyl-carrier-protein] synthase II
MELKTRKVVITGTGLVSSLGDSPAALHDALCAGRSGIGPIELFSTDGIGCPLGGEIKNFLPQRYLGNRNLRPLNRIAQLTASAAQLALETSGWTAEMRRAREVGLVLGTMFCSVRTIAEFDRRAITAGPAYASPMDFANTVINAAAGQTAIWHNLRGINSTIATGTTSGLQAIAYATDMIGLGRATALLAGGGEELCFESVFGFYRAGLLCGSDRSYRTRANGYAVGYSNGLHDVRANGQGQRAAGHFPVPFDARRNGFALGEGAALVMLEDADFARARGARVLAEVRGHGSSYDCSRGWDKERAVAAITRSMRRAMNDARLIPGEIDCLSASANGSPAGDRHEALAIDVVFGQREERLPITANKSMLGETCGAAGALQVAALVETMRDGVLPGIRGLEQPDQDFPPVRIGPQQIRLRYGLVNAVGSDGHCCSLVLACSPQRAEEA